MHHGMTWGRDYWPIALILIALLFMVGEGFALGTNWSNTLSDYARWQLGINTARLPLDKHGVAWWLTLPAWLIVTGWLTYHIWFEVGFSA